MPDEDAAIADWVNPRGEMPLLPAGAQIRAVDADDYPMLVAWWEAHGWPAVPRERLPKLGAIISIRDTDTAAAFCFMDNSGTGVAMVEWIVSNPEASPKAVFSGIQTVVKWLMWRAAEPDLRFTFFLSTCRQPALARVLERCGFAITDTNVIHLCAA